MTRIAIAGGGISGLSLGEALLREADERGVEVEFTVFEAADRMGGKVQTDVVEGNVLEWGPNGFLDREPATLELCERLGLEVLTADESSEKRFIFRKGRLRALPRGAVGLVTNGILPLHGALRVFLEPLIRKPPPENESIFDFASRRIGAPAARLLIQAMVTGIYGGDARQLELRACFPRMYTMEKEHGTLFRAMRAKAKQRKAEGGGSGGPSGPGGVLRTFPGGMEDLIRALEEHLAGRTRAETPVRSVEQADGGFRVHTDDGAEVFDRVVLACPASAAAEIVRGLRPEVSATLEQIPYAPISVICQGYRDPELARRLDGFGYLAPPGQGLRILGSIWSGSIFPEHRGEGTFTTRTMIGGAMDPDILDLTDDEMIALVRRDQKSAVGIDPEPAFVRIYRHARGIPQYVRGHGARIAALEAAERELPGLHFSGNAYRGIGVNDCVRESTSLAPQLLGTTR